MSLTLNQKTNSINDLRKLATEFVSAVDSFGSFNSLYTALDLGNALSDGDFTGDNSGIAKADWVSAVATMQAVAVLSAGQRSALSKVLNI